MAVKRSWRSENHNVADLLEIVQASFKFTSPQDLVSQAKVEKREL